MSVHEMPEDETVSVHEAFGRLEHEVRVNGNTNWVSFIESAEWFRELAQVIQSALEGRLDPEASKEDDDAACLLAMMIEDNPRELPVLPDESYAALKAVLAREGFLEE